MATLPVSGYMSAGTRTEGEMKQSFEDLRDYIEQMIGGSVVEYLTIASGVITPTVGWIKVDTESAAPTDYLVTIQTTNLPAGSMIRLSTTSNSRHIIIQHTSSGVGTISTLSGTNVTLTSSRDGILLRREGTSWMEVYTFWHTTGDRRDYFGLGNCCTYDTGHGYALNADFVDGQHASEFLGVTAKADDSDKLDGIDSTGFIRTSVGATEQSVSGIFSTNAARMRAKDLTGQAPGFEMYDAAIRRGIAYFEGVSQNAMVLRTYDSTGGNTNNRQLAVLHNNNLQFWNGSAWKHLTDSLGQLNLDNVCNETTLPIVSSNLIAGGLNTNSVSGALAPETGAYIYFNRLSFFPSFESEGGTVVNIGCKFQWDPIYDPTNPKVGIYNTSVSGNHDFIISWEYLT